jgi:hypothetical protein
MTFVASITVRIAYCQTINVQSYASV